jgi:alpha-D-xyloside xylohydrolase
MKLKFFTFHFALCAFLFCTPCGATNKESIPFGDGILQLQLLTDNAVRIQYGKDVATQQLPELIYNQEKAPTVRHSRKQKGDIVTIKTAKMQVVTDLRRQTVSVLNKQGSTVFTATVHQLKPATVAGEATHEATLRFQTPKDECLYGLGQFQDGHCNLRGQSRRLTQVNTQISIPLLLSNKGYALLWNNYGLTDYNPADQSISLKRHEGAGTKEVVNVTSTHGNQQETRERNIYEGTLTIPTEGDYSLLLDVGQTMARRHNLSVDGQLIIDMNNLWLPPTTSTIVHLTAGQHTVTAELTKEDRPMLFYQPVGDQTTLRSPAATAVDYTVFVGNADEAIATFRQVSGNVPLMPRWALGYIHCRERFHSQEEILTTANRFRKEQLPVDLLVQDWQYWGKYGWNAMRFDEDNYPDPHALTDSLHNMGIRLMLSVWSKIDKNSEVGRQMLGQGYYIPGTDWIDFFNPDAAAAYWKNFSQRLLPLGIDAWWQDATEPENDDLLGRRIAGGKYPGELFRNAYPLMVNKTVYEGLRHDAPQQRPMILTRCGFPGIQRYGSAMWSGDVGNDWLTLRRQITAGLGMAAAGMPWWTYDAGGFFRPGNQYTDPAYTERMLRWIETAVYLPLMRVHGYMSNTEPWNYSPEAQQAISENLRQRYRLLPYIYSQAAAVTLQGSTLMRPLVFDFPDDAEALRQDCEYMFGPALLVSPVTQEGVREWATYLPQNKDGWYDYHTGRHYDGGQTVITPVDLAHIPVFVRAGSILPLRTVDSQHTADAADAPIELRVYPGADATFTLYEDDGVSNEYEQGRYATTQLTWNERKQKLTVSPRRGSYSGMKAQPAFRTVVVK